jgi:hypothetical protein
VRIFRQVAQFSAVQLLLGPGRIESAARHLGIAAADAIEIAERFDIRVRDTRPPFPDMVGGARRIADRSHSDVGNCDGFRMPAQH